MRTRIGMAAVIATFFLASPSWSAGFSANPAGVAGQVGGGIVEGGCGATLLTQSTSQTIVALNSVACNGGGLHTDNSYFRAYDMTGFPDGFDVCEIQVGVEQASSLGGTQPITVNVYANTGGAFPAGTQILLGTAPVSVADQALAVLDVPLAASVPAGTTEMVLEVFTPNGQSAGNGFFIGTNNLGQSGLSYIMAPDCGVLSPTPTAGIGFPDMHIVLNAVGDAQIAGPAAEIPALDGWGLTLLGFFLGGAAFIALRKRSIA